MTARNFTEFVDLALLHDQNYLHVYSACAPTQRQRNYALRKGVKIESRKRMAQWFEIDFKIN